jgi:hypothetical protein
MGEATLSGAVPLSGGGSPLRHGPLRAGVVLQPAAPRPKLLDQVRNAIRTRHYSYRTEEAYVVWIKRFILFHPGCGYESVCGCA